MPELKTPHRPSLESAAGGAHHRRPLTESLGDRGGESQPAAPVVRSCDPNNWQSSPEQPEFVLERQISAGWVQVRFEIETKASCLIEIYLDTGAGFNSAEVLRVQTDNPYFVADMSWYIPKTIQAIRLAPTDSTEAFKIRNFSMRSISMLTFYARAMKRLARQAASQKRLSKIIKKGLKAVLTGDFRRLAHEIRGRSQLFGIDSTYDYNDWIERHKITPADRQQMTAQVGTWTGTPLVSVLLPVRELPAAQLRATLDSLCRQIYPQWELIAIAGKSLSGATRGILEQYAKNHSQIQLQVLDSDGSQPQALNAGLARAGGEFIAVVEAGDELSEHSLFRMVQHAHEHGAAQWLYSDEDRLDDAGQRIKPFFKPDWSPELVLTSCYTGHLSVFRKSLLQELGGWRADFDGAHHYDLALRAMAAGVVAHHIADVLYHWRQASGRWAMAGTSRGQASAAAQRAAMDYCRHAGLDATLEPSAIDDCFRVRRAVRGNPIVSVVIPTASQPTDSGREGEWYLLNCIRSIRRDSTYRNIEIVVVDNNDMPRALREAIEPYKVKRVSYTRQFNLSAKMNLGAANAQGEYVVFLNDDIEIITPDWIEGMLEHAQDEQVGAVGVKLLFPNDQMQHAGVIWTQWGPDHLFYNEKQSAADRYAPAHLARELMAVTGACVMIKMSDHHLIGGWNEALPLNFNDIDLCLKLVSEGRRNIYTPHVALRHYESVSKTSDDRVDASIQRECKVFMDIWRGKHPKDPYYNPNFIPARAFYRINTQSV